MAQAVARAITLRQPLVAEAGTGTGKTFAYLVPALLYGGKVIVSTGTKTLQDQLFERDLPLIRDALAVPVQALASRSAPFTVLAVGDDHRLQERRIEVGLQTPEQIEVISGLKEGDLVVVGARGDLRPGLLVTPKPQAHAAGER